MGTTTVDALCAPVDSALHGLCEKCLPVAQVA